MRSLAERDALFTQFQFLPQHIVSQFWKRPDIRHRLDSFDDAVQVGYLALVRAAEKYDDSHASGTTFKTYAFRAISNAIISETHRHGLITVPVRHLRDQVRQQKAKGNKTKAAASEATYLRALQQSSGIKMLGGDDLEQTAVAQTGSVLSKLFEPLDSLRCRMRRLPIRQRRLLKKRFGLGREREHTLCEIAQSEGLTKERVRQLVNEAICSLRQTGKIE